MFSVGIISFYTSVFEHDNYIFVYHDQVQQFNFEINQWDRCTAFRFTFKPLVITMNLDFSTYS